MITMSRTYTFEAAHRLPHVRRGHKCGRMHGHSYVIEVEVAGRIDIKRGWIMDFAELDAVVKPLIEQLDHTVLNDVLKNPTSENIAARLHTAIRAGIEQPIVLAVSVSETARSRVTYRR